MKKLFLQDKLFLEKVNLKLRKSKENLLAPLSND